MLNNLDSSELYRYVKGLENRITQLESLQTSIRHPETGSLVRGRAMSSGGVPLVLVTESGLEVPGIPGIPYNVDTPPSAAGSSGSWEPLYVVSSPALGADAITMRLRLAATTGSPGSVSFRLRATVGEFPFDFTADSVSDEYNIANGSGLAITLYHNFNWQHGLSLTTDPVYVAVEGRVDSGSGTYTAYQPIYGNLVGTDMVGATSAGF